MLVHESSEIRHLVGRLPRGAKLRESFEALAAEWNVKTATLSALGAFETAQVTEYHQQDRRYLGALDVGPCEILSLCGNLSIKDDAPFLHAHVTLSQMANQQVTMTGGHLIEGTVFALEFQLCVYDDLELLRLPDKATGLELWPLDPRPPLAAAPPDASPTWDTVAEISAAVAPREEAGGYTLGKGDWIQHPKFGLCRIDGVQGDGVAIIKLPDARRKKVKLDFLRVLEPRDTGGRTVFPVEPATRR